MERRNDVRTEVQKMESLNDSLFDEMSLDELEERLETDPLAIGQLFNLTSSDEMTRVDGCCFLAHCNTDE